jgi:acyl carrier protein
MDEREIIAAARQFVVREFLPGEDPRNVTDTTPLISSGVLDSIGRLKVVTFLEETYGVEFEAHEMSPDYLETLADMAKIVLEKRTNA